MNRLTPLCLTLAATLGLGACDAMTDDSYRGELLFSLEGKVANRRSTVPSDVRLYLVWDWENGVPNIADQLDIQPTFPATFRLNVFRIPDVLSPDYAEHILVPGQYRYAWGYLYAAPADSMFVGFTGFPWMSRDPSVLGTDPRHVIMYMPDAIPEGSISAKFLHGGVEPGFHIYEFKCIGPAKRAEIEACVARFHFPATIEQMSVIVDECGTIDPNYPMIRPAPDALNTELTVELMDDLESWTPDPSECL
jgi:hypothetical protein